MSADSTLNQVILHDKTTSRWLRFSAPYQIVKADRIGDVIPALRHIEGQISDRKWHAAGFLSYESAAAFDAALCTRAAQGVPLLWFGLYPPPEEIQLPEPDFNAYSIGESVPSIGPSEYARSISKIKQYIGVGDTYQVNYTFQLRIPFAGDPWHLFLAMLRAQSPGYSAWIDMGRTAICSASPELFFRLQGNRITCKPMKGTVKRGRTLKEDEMLAEWLHNSEKNRAENLMIVDMIRNDLGRVADAGSVHVLKLFEVERHPTLWQMTSTISADCCKSITDIFLALFPCASITGAPKISTSRIIVELEPVPRGVYTGCIGYITPDRFAQFNVAIRTAVVDRQTGQAEYGSGGGIVWDSISDDEHKEALLKARVLRERRPEFSLLETILWTPEGGCFLLDYHLDRLRDSAAYFGYQTNLDDVRNQLLTRSRTFSREPQKVRLLIDREGVIDIQSAPLNASDSSIPLRVKLAAAPVHSEELFLYHKTTHRFVYDDARRAGGDCDDVLLWNERGELTESCIANIVVEIDGNLITPPVSCGLLAGVYRAWLLDQGKIREKVVRVTDLSESTKIYLINSVRGWQEAVMI
jgi:para-aminobenzoate synthetase / 4-amino-4-deoxychorismate lyase